MMTKVDKTVHVSAASGSGSGALGTGLMGSGGGRDGATDSYNLCG